MNELIKSYLEHQKAQGRAFYTIRQTKSALVNFPVKNLLHPTVDEIISYIGQKKRQPITLSLRCSKLKYFYKWLYQKGMILEDPMTNIKGPKVPTRIPNKVMTKGETFKVLKVCESLDPRDRLLIELLYTSSLRRSELVGLDVVNFDKEKRILRIEKTKTGQGRFIPVGDVAAKLLEDFINGRKQGPIFLNYRNERLGPHYVTDLARRVRKEAKIRTKATSHSFRKSSATHMLREGAPLAAVQALLGHTCMRSTEAYTKVYPKDIVKMHKAYHPREREKNIKYPEIKDDLEKVFPFRKW